MQDDRVETAVSGRRDENTLRRMVVPGLERDMSDDHELRYILFGRPSAICDISGWLLRLTFFPGGCLLSVNFYRGFTCNWAAW